MKKCCYNQNLENNSKNVIKCKIKVMDFYGIKKKITVTA